MSLVSCENCGFSCEESQLTKTKGKCPKCFPEETKAYRLRKEKRGEV